MFHSPIRLAFDDSIKSVTIFLCNILTKDAWCWRLKGSARADVVLWLQIPGRFTSSWLQNPVKNFGYNHLCVCVWCFLAAFKVRAHQQSLTPPYHPHMRRNSYFKHHPTPKSSSTTNIQTSSNQLLLSFFPKDICLQPSSNHRNFQLSNWKASNLYVKNQPLHQP